MTEWTLETKKKKKEESVVKIKECKVCFKILPASTTVCPECGYEFPHEIRDTEAETVSTELVKLSSEDVELAMAKYSDYKKIDNWDDMERFRKAKKYKFMWSIRKCLELGIEIPGKYDFMVRKFAR